MLSRIRACILGVVLVPLALGLSPGGPRTDEPAQGPAVLSHSTSANWSGYASTSARPFSGVSAAWTEPSGACSAKRTYSSFWVGIDGDGSDTVEQTGTEVDCRGGAPVYYAWYEMYPALPVTFPNPVRPGDQLAGSVTDSGGTFTLNLRDVTRGWTETATQAAPFALKHSAEVIAEAPCCTTTGGVLPLTNFGTVHFTASMANATALGNLTPQKITMARGSLVKARPGALGSGENFSVTWHHG
jgi:hypothetical protein